MLLRSLLGAARAGTALLAVTAAGLRAADRPAMPARAGGSRYHLQPQDTVKVVVQGEPDMTAERKIDSQGNFDVPLIGPLRLGGLTAEEAQALIARRYVEGEVFVHPEVVVSITGYSLRDVVVLGQVNTVGRVVFPPETPTISIVSAIALAGGFTQVANPGAVRVTRKDGTGQEHTLTIDVAKMIDGHRTESDGELFQLRPGDVIFVPERRF